MGSGVQRRGMGRERETELGLRKICFYIIRFYSGLIGSGKYPCFIKNKTRYPT
jgi:hypothetical protein